MDGGGQTSCGMSATRTDIVLGLIAEGPLFLSHKTWLQYAEQKRLR
jgi:hypothetical protein